MKNIIKIIYIDDNGLDHHVRLENLRPYKSKCPAQVEMVKKFSHELSEMLGDFFKK